MKPATLLDLVAEHARRRPDAPAHRWRDAVLTWGELECSSNALARALRASLHRPGSPVVVLGHKDPRMLVCFLACVKAGHPYVPLDDSTPSSRVAGIIDQCAPELVLLPEQGQTSLEGLAGGIAQWDREEILARSQPDDGGALEASCWVGPHEPYYTIFTSGSTGRPKGVQISRESLDNFTGWAVDLLQLSGPAAAGHPTVLLNQAPFSFDLSVFDMALALATGGTLFSVDRAQIARLPELHAALASSDVTVWVSTPSFADLCLSDPAFGQELLPRLGLFLFCGETLTPRTAGALLERFPGARIVNTYGPTESTVAVTAVEVDRALLESWPVLPVGRPRPGSTICILDEQGVSLPEGTDGEIAIQGDTLSLGYLGRPDLDARAFTTVEGGRAYRTGDRGRLDGGMLHFAGRLDFQVKLHGYRIEVEDIEANLLALPQVARAVVLPETGADGAISHLHAWVQESAAGTGSELGRMVALKKALRERVPDYMVPKVISFVDAIPLTANGKVDRAAVRGLQ